jgi:hypothetical protein
MRSYINAVEMMERCACDLADAIITKHETITVLCCYSALRDKD